MLCVFLARDFLYGGCRMLKKFLCCLCCVLLAALPAVSVAEATFTMAGFDGEDSTRDWNSNLFFERMKARTGISFTFQQFNKAETWAAAKTAMFAENGQLPDVFFKAALTTPELIRYTESGQLIDLKPLLAENAPNLWVLLEENPDWLAAITLPSGKIGALPSIQTPGPQNGMWINQEWLNKLKLDMPTDMASLRNVLMTFRDGDPNGNGKKDEIPMAFLGPWELKFFSHAWGVVANDYNIYLDENGKVQFWPLDERFTEMAAELHELFAEGLLDPNGFTTADSMRMISDDKSDLFYGAMFSPTPLNLVTFEMSKNFVVMPAFVYEGKQIYRDLFGPITRGAFAITSACEDPAALLRWVDNLYTVEGAIEAMVGIEGENYIVDANGNWDWKGGLDTMDMTAMSNLSVYDTGEMPWLFPNEFYGRYTDKLVRTLNAEMEKQSEFAVSPFPVYTLTEEESAQVVALQRELGRYVDESLARFVTGEWEVHEETAAAFREGLMERGAEEMTAFWQKIADRSRP